MTSNNMAIKNIKLDRCSLEFRYNKSGRFDIPIRIFAIIPI
jgi:hypothetical protein